MYSLPKIRIAIGRDNFEQWNILLVEIFILLFPGLASAAQPSKPSASAVAAASEYNPYKKELDDMLHDLNILEQISGLTGQLRLRYEVCHLKSVTFYCFWNLVLCLLVVKK